MSKIFVCEYNNDDITCKKIFQEENESDANRFAQRKAGGLNTTMKTKIVKDGSKIYQFVVFQSKEKEGYFTLKNNKVLTLNKNNIIDSIKKTLPSDCLEFLTDLTGVSLIETQKKQDTQDSKQESFWKKAILT